MDNNNDYIRTLTSEIDKIQSNGLLINSTGRLVKSNEACEIIEHLIENAKHTKDSDFQELTNLDSVTKSELEDAVELLFEQVKTLNEELRDKELELQQLKLDLNYTNQELHTALSPEMLALNQVKQLVKNNILVSKKPVNDACQAEQIDDKSSNITALRSKECNYFLAKNAELKTQSSELKARAIMMKEKARQIREQSIKSIAESNRLKIQLVTLKADFSEDPANLTQTKP